MATDEVYAANLENSSQRTASDFRAELKGESDVLLLVLEDSGYVMFSVGTD